MAICIFRIDHSDTPAYYIDAYPYIADLITAEQSLDIDTETGAKTSANAIVNTVQDALSSATGAEYGTEQ